MLIVILTIIILSLTFHIMIQPSEILAPYARYIYQSNLDPLLKKILVCPYCIAFWSSLAYVIYVDEYIFIPFGVFIVVYLITKQIK